MTPALTFALLRVTNVPAGLTKSPRVFMAPPSIHNRRAFDGSFSMKVQPGPALSDALNRVHASPRYVF
jgi:hypothetical protein